MPSTSTYLAVWLVTVGLGQALAETQSVTANARAEDERRSVTWGTSDKEGPSGPPRAGDGPQAPAFGAEREAIRQAGFNAPEGREEAQSVTGRATPNAGGPHARSSKEPAGQSRSSPPSGRNSPIPLDRPGGSERGGATSADAPKSGWRGIASVAASLAVVLGLFFVVAWVMRRSTPAGSATLPSEVVEVLGRASLAGRQQVHLLRLGTKLVLVSATPAGVETLSEVTEADEVQRLVGLCRQGHPSSATAAFRHVLT